MEDRSKQAVLFPELLSKHTEVVFDEPQVTSDGGALLLKAVDQRLGLTQRLACCLHDRREPGKVRHAIVDLLRQRIFGLCCGYSDANDVASLNSDPMHKLLLDRDPLLGCDLASQPTVSRFENDRRVRDLYRMGKQLMQTVINRHAKRLPGRQATLVTIDLDPTDDPVHGQQQLSLFNGHYHQWCYLPMLGFVSFNDEKEQYLVAAVLRPGNAPAKKGAKAVLKQLIPALRSKFPQAEIRVRLDGGFACKEVFDYLHKAHLQDAKIRYLVAMARNNVLQSLAETDRAIAIERFEQQQETVSIYGSGPYRAKKWSNEERVIWKAEIVSLPGREPRDNLRFVVTNLPWKPSAVYDFYRGRGDSENRIKELKDGLDLGRMSCHGFWANQLRLLLVAAAYVLMQELRHGLREPDLSKAQVSTLQLRLLKIGGRVYRSVRRVVVHLAASHPWQDSWLKAARCWGAAVP